MQNIRMCLIGFGNVGKALARLLLEKHVEIQDRYSVDLTVVAIKTLHHGSMLDPQGIDLEQALECARQGESLATLGNPPASDDLEHLLSASGASLLVENTPVSYQDGQPAVDHLRLALSRGINAVTANKGPVVHAYNELSALATSNSCRFLFESTVMDGAPIFSLWREALPAAGLVSFRGILNSTTNLILSRMETGDDFEGAVGYAQSIGIAETDPSGDVDGWDAAVKVAALVNVLMGIQLKPQEVQRTGISRITPDQVLIALEQGKRWKLVCEAHRSQDNVVATVEPLLVDQSDPLYNVMGTSSAVTFHSDVLGALTITEADPGPHTTAYGLLADILNIYS